MTLTDIIPLTLGNPSSEIADRPELYALPARYSAARSHSEFDIALVNVPYGTNGQSMRPLGLASLGAYLQTEGFRAKGFDLSDCKESIHALVTTYRLHEYPAVGLSFYNINAVAAYEMASTIKRLRPACIVIAGGPHVSALKSRILKQHPDIDILVSSEGEEPLVEVLRSLQSASKFGVLPGVTWHSNGFLAEGPERGRIESLDSLPAPLFDFESPYPAKSLLFYDRNTARVKDAAALVTSRSCPFQCSFCAIILIGRKWRKSAPAKIISDLLALERHDHRYYEHIYFLDANFFVDVRRTLEVAEALHEFRPDLTFSFSTRVNQLIRGGTVIPRLRELGLRAIELGIESGSELALKRFAKDTTPEQNSQAIQILRENRLDLFLDFIMFDAEANVQDLRSNLTFLEQNALDSYVPWDHIVSHMTPYIGTAIRKHYEEVFGRSFEDDVLPNPEDLLTNCRVRSIYIEICKLKQEFPRLARAIEHLESLPVSPWNEETARRVLNIVTLRRLPFIVLRALVRQAESDRPISYSDAMMKFHDVSGASLPLDEFLHYVVQ